VRDPFPVCLRRSGFADVQAVTEHTGVAVVVVVPHVLERDLAVQLVLPGLREDVRVETTVVVEGPAADDAVVT
jgi:hypothetical protein